MIVCLYLCNSWKQSLRLQEGKVNGTVPVDSTIGNDTFFVVTWTIKKTEIVLQDQKERNIKPQISKKIS